MEGQAEAQKKTVKNVHHEAAEPHQDPPEAAAGKVPPKGGSGTKVNRRSLEAKPGLPSIMTVGPSPKAKLVSTSHEGIRDRGKSHPPPISPEGNAAPRKDSDPKPTRSPSDPAKAQVPGSFSRPVPKPGENFVMSETSSSGPVITYEDMHRNPIRAREAESSDFTLKRQQLQEKVRKEAEIEDAKLIVDHMRFVKSQESKAPTNVSSKDFKGLTKRSATVIAGELRRVLLAESDMTTTSRKSARRKKGLLELAQEEATIGDTLDNLGESDPEDEVLCCMSKKAKKDKFVRSHASEPGSSSRDRLMIRMQKIAKWLVVCIAVVDFCMAVQDVYDILRRRMMYEFFFVKQVYNCEYMISGGFRVIMLAHIVHGLLSVALLFMRNKGTCDFAYYWIISQIFLFYMMVVEGFFKTRFDRNSSFSNFIMHWGPRFILDMLELFVVVFRFYKLYNPFHLRLKQLAASARVDRSLNSELHLRTSPFLQSKAAVRQAATFETLAVVKRLQQVYRNTGIPAKPEIVFEEIRKAILLLSDKRKFPKNKILSDIEEELAATGNEESHGNDGETVFDETDNDPPSKADL